LSTGLTKIGVPSTWSSCRRSEAERL
jgi:hypothetical protein